MPVSYQSYRLCAASGMEGNHDFRRTKKINTYRSNYNDLTDILLGIYSVIEIKKKLKNVFFRAGYGGEAAHFLFITDKIL